MSAYYDNFFFSMLDTQTSLSLTIPINCAYLHDGKGILMVSLEGKSVGIIETFSQIAIYIYIKKLEL